MDIDLLITPQGECGLLSSENFIRKVLAVSFDPENGSLFLEFTDVDHQNLNIPVEPEFYDNLDVAPYIHIGAVKGGKIAQAYQVPLMFLNDPYRANAFGQHKELSRPLQAFQVFVKQCVLGQPVHRADAGDEDTIGCILGDAKLAALEFAPHLSRRYGMEVAPKYAPTINAPGLGLGGSGGGGRSTYTGTGRSNPKNTSDDADT